MPTSPSSRPTLALAMGDPSGIGAEIIFKAITAPALKNMADYIVVGDLGILDRALTIIKKRRAIPAKDIKTIQIADLRNVPLAGFSFGKEKAAYGRASIEYIHKAFELVRSGRADAMVTAPINKSSAKKSGFRFPGHTEYLADLAGVKDYVMMLAGGPLRVSLVTRHVPLSKVSGLLTAGSIEKTIGITLKALKEDFGIKNPRIGVCALNPHASDGGMFGSEEKKVISPAVGKFRGSSVSGPYPADSLFYDAYHGKFDCVICLYHDQGLIPLKMIARDSGVNITLGLGFIRTSPDHGTAFDIAGKGIADPHSMEMAIKVAADMALNRKRHAIKK